MSSDEYEVSDPITIGGASGQYMYASPWHTECEWAIISVTGLGTLASTATFVVGTKNPKQPTLSTNGSDSFGNALSSSPDSNNGLPAYVGALTSQAPHVTYGGDNFMPMPSPAFVYLTTTTPATTEVLVTLQFRRKLERVIPNAPRQKPQTHTHAQPRQGARTFTQGFAAQYPQEGKPYEHQPPQEQDTGMARRGVMPLGPTTIKHRGVAKQK